MIGHYQWGFRDSVLGFAEFGAFPLSEDGATVARCVGIDDFVPFESQLGKRRCSICRVLHLCTAVRHDVADGQRGRPVSAWSHPGS